jgi:hypothetical protein
MRHPVVRQGVSIRNWSQVESELQIPLFAPPDFLLILVALANLMRLSLKKGAHAAVSDSAWQGIRVGMTKRRGLL